MLFSVLNRKCGFIWDLRKESSVANFSFSISSLFLSIPSHSWITREQVLTVKTRKKSAEEPVKGYSKVCRLRRILTLMFSGISALRRSSKNRCIYRNRNSKARIVKEYHSHFLLVRSCGIRTNVFE